jgi:hypothetical protein
LRETLQEYEVATLLPR